MHRDVKPANILLENGVERVKITDFGLARAANDATITRTGEVAGTPQYMSPEQAQGHPVDARSDLFSLGSVIYAMATGRSPFRAETTIAALRRVCDDTPRPLREINGDIPDWLAAIVSRLLAKQPAERFQAAAEVADVLGQHLAELQDPRRAGGVERRAGGVSLPIVQAPQGSHVSRSPRNRWVLAAAATAVLLLTGISLSEATGVTHVIPTVVRIVTGEGTLVVETDPDVHVTVEGNGDFVFKLAGGQTIRVPSGDYKVRAAKDGKPVPLDKDLVTIARGGQQVVRVKLEAPLAPPVAKSEQGAFVLLGGEGVAERKFDTLAEAVQSASDGDTIEVRGNGPFVNQPISIGQQALTIRAAAGYRPVISGNASRAMNDVWYPYLLHTQGRLVLEGLELHMTGPEHSVTVLSELGPSHMANCRFVLNNGSMSICTTTPVCTVRNCEFAGVASDDWPHVLSPLSSARQLTLDNNIFRSPSKYVLGFQWHGPDLHNVAVRLNHNTMVAGVPVVHDLGVVPESAGPGAAPDRQPVRIHVSANLVDATGPPLAGGDTFSMLLPPNWVREDAKPLSAEEAERLLPRLMAWHEERNLYRKGMSFQMIRRVISRVKEPGKPEREETDEVLPAGRTLADWLRLWKAGDSGSAEGVIRYEGGNILAKLKSTPERVTPADFRLRPDSAGYRAGKDAKDLGADVDLVGPGPAYERWKKTPEYQQWLKETKQVSSQ